MDKVYAAARALALLLAIAAAFVAIPNLNVAAALVILGIITGIGASTDDGIRGGSVGAAATGATCGLISGSISLGGTSLLTAFPVGMAEARPVS
ncbi:MAG: hypothetical protein IPP45_14740 [Sphingomonadales bacterium]|nr:hypothetical protein [Sphingomonadales bacterium]